MEEFVARAVWLLESGLAVNIEFGFNSVVQPRQFDRKRLDREEEEKRSAKVRDPASEEQCGIATSEILWLKSQIG